MSVTYMLALEREPWSYEKLFSQLTKGVSDEVQAWILEKIPLSGKNLRILEVGCGPGGLARKVLVKSNRISLLAIDNNKNMVKHAAQTPIPDGLVVQQGSAIELPGEKSEFDIIYTTFMLSELNPFEQQIFLRQAWLRLKPEGKLILADEFEPQGFTKLQFKMKRWYYKRKAHRLKTGETHPLQKFLHYLEPIGFSQQSSQSWTQGSIQAFEFQKQSREGDKPGFYRPSPHEFTGIKAFGRATRCVLTGQIDQVPIEPGIYEAGHPTQNSPVLVTANYEYTFYKVMRDLTAQKVDAWVLCVDSRGINVWCAARGPDFGNKQVIQAVEASGIVNLVSHHTLILPQLSAGGVAIPQIPKSFPFTIKYGPVWSSSINEYLETKPARKPAAMRMAIFGFPQRMEAGVTHTAFILRKFLFWPSVLAILILCILASISTSPALQLAGIRGTWVVGWLWLAVTITGIGIALFFPITAFTRIFIKKGIILAAITTVLLSVIYWQIFKGDPRMMLYLIPNAVFSYWFGLFATMSFSGYTMDTSPRGIGTEYPFFVIANLILLIATIIALVIAIVYEIFYWN